MSAKTLIISYLASRQIKAAYKISIFSSQNPNFFFIVTYNRTVNKKLNY